MFSKIKNCIIVLQVLVNWILFEVINIYNIENQSNFNTIKSKQY